MLFKTVVIGCLFIAIAIPIGYFALTRSIDKLAAPSWPVASARVVTSDLAKRLKSGAWCIQLRYQFVVDHKTFTSSRLSPMSSVACYRDRQAAAAVFERVQAGARIGIHYDPADPGNSIVFLDGLDFSDVLLIGLTLLLLLAGIGSLRRARGLSGGET